MSPPRRGKHLLGDVDAEPTFPLPERILFTGFMATGKSAVGRRLAAVLGRPFVDLDRVIESAEGTRIGELISRLGEQAFRRIESRELSRIARLPRTVIATGGGTLLSDENRGHTAGPDVRLFVLTASVDEILARLARDPTPRPLLAKGPGDIRERVTALVAARAPRYAALGGEMIDTTGLSVDDVARRVFDRLRAGAERGAARPEEPSGENRA